jgi:protoheme IX farnesyltransferase
MTQMHRMIAPAAAAGTAAQVDTRASAVAAAVELTKPRITRMVTMTAGVGFALAAMGRAWTASELALAAIGCLVGTALSAAGANALNMCMERDRDARMQRTAGRPLPSGRITRSAATSFGITLCALGVGVLFLAATPAAAAVSAATILLYLLLYTPLKPLTPHATLVGALPGALPPLIGWTAAAGAASWTSLLQPGGWLLVALMVAWQMPHFLAIAWMYRDDYARGGYAVLPVVEHDGSRTARASILWAIALIPISVACAWFTPLHPGWLYIAAAILAGTLFLTMAVRFAAKRTDAAAKTLFLASIAYLPIVLLTMVGGAAMALVLAA